MSKSDPKPDPKPAAKLGFKPIPAAVAVRLRLSSC